MKKEKRKVKSFAFFKKHKKIAILLACIVLFISSYAFINYSRYVKDIVQTYYLRTKKFYFNSNRLTLTNKKYQSNPWVINDKEYEISISMNSKLNSIKMTDDDIIYNAKCEVLKDGAITDVAECYINGTTTSEMERTIPGKKNSSAPEPNIDNFNIVVKPIKKDQLKDGERIEIVITATSIKPYIQTLSATFELIAGNYGVSYEIDDKLGRRYIDCIVTNTVPNEKKIVELTINNPEEIIFDQNNRILDIIESYSQEDLDKYGLGVGIENGYIKKVRFKVDEKASALVRYYKKNPNSDHSYRTNAYNSEDTSISVSLKVLNESEYSTPIANQTTE